MKANETIDYHIKYAWHTIANFYNKIAGNYDLTQATGFVLLNINSKTGTPATSIAPTIGLQANSLSRILKNMEDEGLIFRQKSELDGRMVKIFLTEKGKEKKNITKKVVKEYNEFILNNIPKEKQSIFFEVMHDIIILTEDYKKRNT